MKKLCPSCKSEFEEGEVFCPNDGARLETASQSSSRPPTGSDRLVGTILSDRYRILRRIGEGGMGLVYEAEHITIEKRIALKVLRDDFSSRPEVVQRFKQEAKSASRIGNEHIVDISDFGVTPSGASYFAMELLEGEDLATVLEREEAVPLERAVDILLQCCKALGAAHAKGIVHRDMKPENIFLTVREGRSDFVKLVDFGIAKMSEVETAGAPGRKLTKTGMIFGTPEYMSPEQAAGKPLDHRVDLYALAVILFELLTGRVPFVGDTFMGILTQQMFEDPPPFEEVNPHVSIPPAVKAFVLRGLAKEPDERFQSCDAMAQALREAMEGVAPSPPTASAMTIRASGGRAARASAETLMEPVPRRSRGVLVVGVGVAVLAAALGASAVWVRTQPGEPDESLTSEADSSDTSLAEEAAGLRPPPSTAPRDASAPVALAAPDESDAGPAQVTVNVTTTPEGARVYVVDRGEVCRETPCSFQTPSGIPISIRASRGRAQAEAERTPTESTSLSLELRAPRGGGPSGARVGGTETAGRGIGDLKIPDFARRP